MNLIILSGPNGERRVEEGSPYKLMAGEMIVGAEADLQSRVELNELKDGVEEAGIAWGDAISSLTKSIGIKPCSACERRRQILNELKQNGVKETLRRIKETFNKKGK